MGLCGSSAVTPEPQHPVAIVSSARSPSLSVVHHSWTYSGHSEKALAQAYSEWLFRRDRELSRIPEHIDPEPEHPYVPPPPRWKEPEPNENNNTS